MFETENIEPISLKYKFCLNAYISYELEYQLHLVYDKPKLEELYFRLNYLHFCLFILKISIKILY